VFTVSVDLSCAGVSKKSEVCSHFDSGASLPSMSAVDPHPGVASQIAQHTDGIRCALSETGEALRSLLATPAAQKARTLPLAWISGFARGAWSCKGSASERLAHGYKHASESVAAYSVSRGWLRKHVLLVPVEEGWTAVHTQDEAYLRALDEHDDAEEFGGVVRSLHRTLPAARVLSICRVEQAELRARYELERSLLARRFQLDKVSSAPRDMYGALRFAADAAESSSLAGAELQLWHGCRHTDPRIILSDEVGFDPRFSQSGMWGRASYFASDASYSDGYAHRLAPATTESDGSSIRQLFLVNVLVGRSEERAPDGGIRRPSRGYDSVTGVTGSSRVFMLYETSTRAYPTHVVTYEA
jgi:hypothetical protein